MKGKVFWQPVEYAEVVDITQTAQQLYEIAAALILSEDNEERFDSQDLAQSSAEAIADFGEMCGIEDESWKLIRAASRTKAHDAETNKFRSLMRQGIPHRHNFDHEGPICQYPQCKVRSGSDKALTDERIRQAWVDGGEHDHVFSSVGKCMWPRCGTEIG